MTMPLNLKQVKDAEKLLALRLELGEIKRDMAYGRLIDYEIAERMEEDFEDAIWDLENEITLHRA